MNRRRTLPTAVATATAAALAVLAGAVPASAADTELDWYFRAPAGGPTTTFTDTGGVSESEAVAYALVCDVDGQGDRPTTVSGNRFVFHTDDGDVTTAFGRGSDRPLCGDWDGDGLDTPAVRRGATTYLASSLDAGGGTVVGLSFGRTFDLVHTGDWDGDGDDTVAVQRGNTFHASSANVPGGGGVATSRFGRDVTDAAVTGRFAGPDAPDTLAVVRAGRWYVTDQAIGTPAALTSRPVVSFGRCSDLPLAGSPDPAAPAQLAVLRVSPTPPGFVCE